MGSYIIYRSLGGKQSAEKIWPMEGEKGGEKVTQVIDPELYRKIMDKATGHKKKK